MKKSVKIAVIGTGGISALHINGYQKKPEAEIYALCDINKQRVKNCAEANNVPLERTFTDYKEMFKKLPEIDAVSVCTWNSEHAPATIAALKAGKHVIVEKPMAMNTREAKAMLAAAEKSGKLLMIGFVRRQSNDTRILKEFVDSGQFGDIYYAKAAYMRRNGNPGGWFGDKSRSGGGPLIDLGVHVIDLVRYIMGNPKPVSVYGATFHKLGNRDYLKSAKDYEAADAGTKKAVCDVEDLAAAMIRFDNGAVLQVETSFDLHTKKPHGSVELFGTKAGATLDPKLEIFTELNGYLVDINLHEDTSIGFCPIFERQMDHFIDVILGRTECIAPAEDGVVLMQILDAIYRSAETGREVRIKP